MTMVSTATDERTLTPGTTVRILYVNGEGQTSERTIDIIRRFTSRHDVTYLRAWCHLRKEERTFRTDRVLAVLDSQPTIVRAATTSPRPTDSHLRTVAESLPGPAAPAPSNVKHGTLGRFLVFVIVAALGILVWSEFDASRRPITPEPTPLPQPIPTPIPVPTPAPDPAPIPIPAPTPSPETIREVIYRGNTVEVRRTDGETFYLIRGSGKRYSSLHDARIAINTDFFIAKTGVTSPAVIELYAAADANRDGEISWEEVRRFQRALGNSYAYIANDRALRPDEFIAAGGGDCEDWALMTAGMLRFWDIPVFIGSLASSTGHHAIALIPTDHVPKGARTIDVGPGTSLRPGHYVPIDYEEVGHLSNAVGRRFTVERIWAPETIYGWSI